MARKIATIKEVIRTDKNTFPSLAPILFAEEGGSKVGLLNNIADVFAINVNILEQLMDEFASEQEIIADSAITGSSAWLQRKLFEFQYDATTPQFVQLIDLVPAYTVIDENLRIITRAAVIENGNGRITVKVAKSNSPVSLSSAEKTALAEYLDVIEPAGPKITVVSTDADFLYVNAEVFYDGQFVDSIQTDVEASINEYLATLDFNGLVAVSKIQDAIQSVAGVKDVVINQVKARAVSTAFASATIVTRQWLTASGYIVEETTSGETFADTITYTAE